MHFIGCLYNKKRGGKKKINVLYYAPFMNLNLLYSECAELSMYIGVHDRVCHMVWSQMSYFSRYT